LLPIGFAANRLRIRATTDRSCPALQGTLIFGRAPWEHDSASINQPFDANYLIWSRSMQISTSKTISTSTTLDGSTYWNHKGGPGSDEKWAGQIHAYYKSRPYWE
jgi:hypothetical protein